MNAPPNAKLFSARFEIQVGGMVLQPAGFPKISHAAK
jgi:hypothetical protein